MTRNEQFAGMLEDQQAAFDEFYRSNANAIYKMTYALLRDECDAQNVVEAAWMIFYGKRKQTLVNARDSRSIVTFWRITARNLAINLIKKEPTKNGEPEERLSNSPHPSMTPLQFWLSVERTNLLKAACEALADCLAQLTDDTAGKVKTTAQQKRRVLFLLEVEHKGLTAAGKDIWGDETNAGINRVRRAKDKAMGQLKKCMKRKGFNETP